MTAGAAHPSYSVATAYIAGDRAEPYTPVYGYYCAEGLAFHT